MNAEKFHTQMATGIFKQIYPVIAKNIITKTQKHKGQCIDVGGGSGVLAVELAKISQLKIKVIDPLKESIELADQYIHQQNMTTRVEARKGIAEHLPIASNSIDLVVSRGSLYFWDNQIQGMNEIYRVLKPNGFAYIGGGMGSTALSRQIRQRAAKDADWLIKNKNRFRKNLPIHLELMMRKTRIPYWEIESSDEGTWALFKKI
jgi:ubiquinone/menaquinone biosynthesis C-methylase UbiE